MQVGYLTMVLEKFHGGKDVGGNKKTLQVSLQAFSTTTFFHSGGI